MNRFRRRLAACLTVVSVMLAAPLIVWAAGGVSLPGTQPADGVGDPSFPPFRNGALPGTFTRPGICDNCHWNFRAAGQAMYEPWDTWAGSMMAQSARDPLFWASVDIANQDDDDALGNAGVGDMCLRCHVPRAWYEGRSHCTTRWGEEFDGACLQGLMTAPDTDFEGNLCHFCHRMYDASNAPAGQFRDPAAPYAENGQVYLTTEDTTMLGPFSDALPPQHFFRADPFQSNPAMCGQCHDVTHPLRNRKDAASGADLGYPMPVERTYSEYRQSRIADVTAPEHATCQGCHMPKPDLDGDGTPDPGYACLDRINLRGDSTTMQGPLHKHEFAGGSSWMLQVIKGLYGTQLGRNLELDNGIAAARNMLTKGAVTLQITAPPSVAAGEDLAVNVRVVNLAGHKFPTGYPEGRRAWIQLTAGEDLDRSGTLAASEIQFTSGAYDDATGELTVDAQAKVYEATLGIFDYNGTGQCDTVGGAGRPMFHFALNDCIVEDNRIPPLGFAPSPDTAPVGYVYPPNPALPGTLANWDDSAFLVPVPEGTTRPYLVEARLRYQSVSKEYVDFLRDTSRSTCDPFDAGCDPTVADARPNRGEKMHDLWEANGRSAPVDMAQKKASVSVVAPPVGACCALGACTETTERACGAAEGDFQGASTACATAGCPPPALPPGEASNVRAGAAPLRVTGYDEATGEMSVSFDPACDASDHEVTWGPLSDVGAYPHSGLACGLGIGGTATFTPDPGSVYFLVVGRSAVAEGSYGRDSFLAERPQRAGVASCDLPQDLSAACR